MKNTIDDSDSGEMSDMEYSVPTFDGENSVSAKREAAPAATLPSRRRSRVNWGEASSISNSPTPTSRQPRLRRSSTVDDRIDVDDSARYYFAAANQFPPRHNRTAARRSRSVLSNFSIADSIASLVETALFDTQSCRSIHSHITEDEVDRLLVSQENDGDDYNDNDNDNDNDVDDASTFVSQDEHRKHRRRPSRRSVDPSPPRRGRRLSWTRNSMVSYLTDDDEALEDVIMDELSQPLPLNCSVGSEDEEGYDDEPDNSYRTEYRRGSMRRCLTILTIASVCLATSFTAGYFYASNGASYQYNHSTEQSKYEPQEPTEYHVSNALEDVLRHVPIVDDNDRLPSDDIFIEKSRKSKDVQVLVRCDEPEGCLEAMKKSSSVHVAPTQDMSRVSLNVQPEHFDDLRSVHGLHLDIDHLVEAIEDDVEEADGDDIDLADLIRHQNGGSIRGRRQQRRAQQYVSEGFKMIQAVMGDGSPFPAGPHRKRICIPDTGTCKGHPDLLAHYPSHLDGIDLVMDDGNTVLHWDEDKEGHGCHNNGLISALDNEFGYVGIGGSDVFITRGLQDDKRATVSQMMAALDQCVNAGASIIVLSLGCTGCQHALNVSYFRSLADKGIMVFAASGNIGGDPDAELMYPASFPGSVISVSAVNSDESVWYKSAVNEQVEFCSHGSSVVSTGFSLVGDSYNYNFVRKSGTSMSTPQVAAVAAHLWSHYPRCSATQIRSVLAATAKKVDTGSGRLQRCTRECGFGIPQLQDAYHLLDGTKSFPGVSQDYDCDVGGMILSATASVCDCINGNGNPSKCIDPSTTYDERSPLDFADEGLEGPFWPDKADVPASKENLPRCKDKRGARFRINVSRERNANKRGLQNARQRRRNRPRGCKYIRQKKTRAQFWCQMNEQVRNNCQRSCSTLAGVVYNSCSA